MVVEEREGEIEGEREGEDEEEEEDTFSTQKLSHSTNLRQQLYGHLWFNGQCCILDREYGGGGSQIFMCVNFTDILENMFGHMRIRSATPTAQNLIPALHTISASWLSRTDQLIMVRYTVIQPMAPLAAIDIQSKKRKTFRGRIRVVKITGSNNRGMNCEEMIDEFDPRNLIQIDDGEGCADEMGKGEGECQGEGEGERGGEGEGEEEGEVEGEEVVEGGEVVEGEGEDRGATTHCIGKRRKVNVGENVVALGVVASVDHYCAALLKRVQSAAHN